MANMPQMFRALRIYKRRRMKTTLPENPIKDYDEWRKYIAKQVQTPADKFESEFMRIWSEFKQSIIKARTK